MLWKCSWLWPHVYIFPYCLGLSVTSNYGPALLISLPLLNKNFSETKMTASILKKRLEHTGLRRAHYWESAKELADLQNSLTRQITVWHWRKWKGKKKKHFPVLCWKLPWHGNGAKLASLYLPIKNYMPSNLGVIWCARVSNLGVICLAKVSYPTDLMQQSFQLGWFDATVFLILVRYGWPKFLPWFDLMWQSF